MHTVGIGCTSNKAFNLAHSTASCNVTGHSKSSSFFNKHCPVNNTVSLSSKDSALYVIQVFLSRITVFVNKGDLDFSLSPCSPQCLLLSDLTHPPITCSFFLLSVSIS